MKVTVYFDKEDEIFFTEAEMDKRKEELAHEMMEYSRDYREVEVVIDSMTIEELWDAFTPEAKKNIVDRAVKRWFSDTDFYVQGDIEI